MSPPISALNQLDVERCPILGCEARAMSVYRDGGYWLYCPEHRTGIWRNPLKWDGTRRLPWAEWRNR